MGSTGGSGKRQETQQATGEKPHRWDPGPAGEEVRGGRKSEHILMVEEAEFGNKMAHGVEKERKKVFFLNSKVLSGIFT